MAGVVLLTGGTGMVGRNVLEHPAAASHQFVAPTRRQLDLTDFEATRAYLRELRPAMVVHCAGTVGGILANARDPVRFLVENADMGRNLLLAAREAGVPRLLNLASSCIYPRDCDQPLEEDMILQGPLEPTNEGYALAKIMVLRLAAFISREDPALHYKTLIPCNLYGRHDRFDADAAHLVPAIIRKVHEASRQGSASVDIWGDGTARREFMYAGDCAGAIIRAIEQFDSLPDLMNVGVGTDHSVDDYYRAVAEVIGWRGQFVHDTSKPTGMRRKLVSVARQAQWGWQPSTPLRDGIARTYRFYTEEYAA